MTDPEPSCLSREMKKPHCLCVSGNLLGRDKPRPLSVWLGVISIDFPTLKNYVCVYTYIYMYIKYTYIHMYRDTF